MKLEIEKKQCSPLIRKYIFLATNTSKYMDFLMDLCCKMAILDVFNKTWTLIFFYLLLIMGS